MNRAERRRMQKDEAKGNARYNLKRNDIVKLKEDATHDATKEAFKIMLVAPIWHMHYKEGWGKQRCQRLIDGMVTVFDDIESEHLSFTDLIEAIKDDMGIDINTIFKEG